MELQSLTHVTLGQREGVKYNLLVGRAIQLCQAMIKDSGAIWVALLPSVNSPSLLFSAHMSVLQMDTRYLERKLHISTMTVWYSSVMIVYFEGGGSSQVKIAKPITPGILKYQFVKKVKIKWRKNRVFICLFLFVTSPPKARVVGKKQRQLPSYSVLKQFIHVVYVLYANAPLDLGYSQGR